MGLLGSFLSTPVGAADDPEQFPQRPIRLIVPWSPGAFTDTLARLVADLMGRGLGQPVIVENRPGANGILGTESVAKSAPDGYTLLIATAETHAINPSIYTKLRYDPVTDFSPVGSIASVPLFLVTHPDVVEKTFPELMNAAKKTPGRFKYASWGTGSTGHLAIELLNAPAGNRHGPRALQRRRPGTPGCTCRTRGHLPGNDDDQWATDEGESTSSSGSYLGQTLCVDARGTNRFGAGLPRL